MYRYINYRELFEQAAQPTQAQNNLKNSAILLSLSEQDHDALVDLSRPQPGKTKEPFIRPAELVNDKNPEEVRGNITVVLLVADSDNRDAIFPEPPAEKPDQLVLQFYPKQLDGVDDIDQGPITLPVRVIKDDPKSAVNMIIVLAAPKQGDTPDKVAASQPPKPTEDAEPAPVDTETALKTGELVPNESKAIKSFDSFVSEGKNKR